MDSQLAMTRNRRRVQNYEAGKVEGSTWKFHIKPSVLKLFGAKESEYRQVYSSWHPRGRRLSPAERDFRVAHFLT